MNKIHTAETLLFDLTAIEDFKTVCLAPPGKVDPASAICFSDEEGMVVPLLPSTQVLITSTLAIGIGVWVEASIDEVWTRFNIYQALLGPFLGNEKFCYYFCRDDINLHLGLKTNTAYEPPGSWLMRLYKHIGVELKTETPDAVKYAMAYFHLKGMH